MQPYFTHKQFEFSSCQRELMLQLAESARLSLQKNRSDAADREETSLVPLDQLLAELAKFVYHVGDVQYRKISLSAPLLMRLLFELMQQLGSKLDKPAPGQEAAQTEQLHLYYFLSYDLTYYYSMQEHWVLLNK